MNRKKFPIRHCSLFLCCLLCILPFLAGCAPSLEPEKPTVDEDGNVTVGTILKVKNRDNRLTLLDNKDALAADGLYYAAWTAGDSEPYENQDGDTVDLYDAQLYLLLGESQTDESAQHNMDTWLAAAKENYEVEKEEAATYNGQGYTIITYRCQAADTPYERGVSAFCTNGSNAVCIELTCQASYSEDLSSMMADFLSSCDYNIK